MDGFDVISIIALFVAGAAATFAERSANSAERSAESAERANAIAQHNERLGIYKSLQKFRSEVTAHGHAFPDAAIWPLADAANLSEFYFPQSHYRALRTAVDTAISVKGLHDLWKGEKEAGQWANAQARYPALNAEMGRFREQLQKCDDDLRAYLRMEPPEGEA